MVEDDLSNLSPAIRMRLGEIEAEIGEAIEAHGGWADAFITDPKKLEELKGQARHGQ